MTRESAVSFLWFWSFWHWCVERHREGSLLRGPVHGMGGHWDEWLRHEATSDELRAIADVGRSASHQRAFVRWLARRWAAEATWRGEPPPVRFVLGQLARVAPFDQWPAFGRHRAAYGVPGIAAVVLAEGSEGAPDDVRRVEAIAVPADDDSAQAIVAEGFEVDQAQLAAARAAAIALLRGGGLARLLALWSIGGRRPYPRALRALLGVGWLTVCALLALLMAGPDPGDLLRPVTLALLGVWSLLATIGISVAAFVCAQAWRVGRRGAARIERGQVRLRMNGGLTIVGSSAGLPFSLNVLLAAQRAIPRASSESWLWRHLRRADRAGAMRWAATGAVHADGRIGRVMLDPKLRACLAHPTVAHLLVPRQRDTAAVTHVAAPAPATFANAAPAPTGIRLGFASDRSPLRAHGCRHLAEVVMTLGGLWSAPQAVMNALALGASIAMLSAAGDLRHIILPPDAPAVVAPAAASPYAIWVAFDTRHPGAFLVALESEFWSNRRVRVEAADDATASARAALPLSRRKARTEREASDGIVWVERRRRFLFRELAPGERIGRYTVSYLGRTHAR